MTNQYSNVIFGSGLTPSYSILSPLPPSSPSPPSPQGKEVATQIKILAPGTVRFDDIAEEELKGAVRHPVIRSFTHGRGKEAEPTPGEIIYQSEIDG